MPMPIVGDIVWLGQFNGACIEPVAAIITAVKNPDNPKSDLVLIAFRNGSSEPVPNASYSEILDDGSWSWPSRP